MPPRVFFCYAREDENFALRLARELKQQGVEVWVDQWDIPPEADWDKTIDNALRECSRLLIVLSPASVQSSEVRGELRTALDLGKPILPILYRQCDIPRQLRIVQFVDFTGPEAGREAALKRVLSACRGETDSGQQMQEVIPGRNAGKWPSTASRSSRRIWLIGLLAVLALVVSISWIALGRRAEEHQRMNRATLSPDGSYVAAATGQGSGNGIVRVWDVNSGRELHRFSTKEGPFWVVAWSPTNNKLAAGDHEGKIRIYEAGIWKLSQELTGPRSFTKFIAWSPDGTAVATGDDTGTIWAWNVADGKVLFRSSPHTNNISAGAWSPDGAKLATASWDNSVAIVDGRNGHLLARLKGHSSYVETVAWSPDSKWIASGSLEAPYLIVWDAAGQPQILEGHRNSVERVAWSSDGSYLASGSKDDTVQFWDGKTFRNVGRFNLVGSPISGEILAWSKSGNRLASGDNANVWILDPMGNAQQKLAGYTKDPYRALEIGGWSQDGKRLAAFRSGDGAKVWDIASGRVLGSFRVGFLDAITN
jgi:WD40 repeat protein